VQVEANQNPLRASGGRGGLSVGAAFGISGKGL